LSNYPDRPKRPQRTAEATKVRIEHLAVAAATGAPLEPETAAPDAAISENPVKYEVLPECATPRYGLIITPLGCTADGEGFDAVSVKRDSISTSALLQAVGGAESGAVNAGKAVHDPDLVELLKAWPALPPEARASIMAVIRGTAVE
jgi:hypothetical protein